MISIQFEEIKKENPKGVLLDLDNTLYDADSCYRHALEQCYAIFKEVKNISFEEFKQGYNEAREQVKKRTTGQAASHSRLLYFQAFCENQFGKTDIDLTTKLEGHYWKSVLGKMEVFEEVVDFLIECKKNNIKTCIVTDLTAHIQFQKIKALKIDTYIDYIVSSEEAGREKPSKEIFTLALEKLNMKAEEVIHIGDDDERDGKGNVHGIKTFIVKHEKK